MNTDDLETKAIIEPSEIKSRLDAMDEKLSETIAAAKSAPDATAITAEIKSLKDTIAVISKSVEDLPADYSGQIKAIAAQVDAFQTGAALHGTPKDAPAGFKAIVDQVMEAAIYQSILASGEAKTAPQIATVSQDSHGNWSERTEIPSFAAAGFKAPAPVVISDMAGSDTVARRPGFVEARDWAMGLMGRIPTVITRNAASYYVPRETDPSRYGAWKTVLAANVNGAPVATNVATVADSDGCMIGSVHRFWNATDALLGSAVVVSFDPATDIITYVTDSLDFDATSGWKVTSENYAAIPELGEKPNGFVGTTGESFALKTLPTIIPTTVNALNTIQGMQALIERKLPARDRRNMSRHLIYGDGTADELQGLRTYAGAQSYDWSDGVSGDNQCDAIMRAINLIPWGVPISVIMSQVDLPALTLLKGSDGHYMKTGSFGMVPLTQIGLSWYLGAHELVFDFACASGDFTPINFSGASEIADQDTAALLWGYSGDDFLKNIIRARYEATRAHAIVDANEYVIGEFDAAP